jgi:hypothetical protein
LQIAPLISKLGVLDKQVGRDLSVKGNARIDGDAVRLASLGLKLRGLEKAPNLALTLIAAKVASDASKEADDLKQYGSSHSLASLENFLKCTKDSSKENQDLVALLKTYLFSLS